MHKKKKSPGHKPPIKLYFFNPPPPTMYNLTHSVYRSYYMYILTPSQKYNYTNEFLQNFCTKTPSNSIFAMKEIIDILKYLCKCSSFHSQISSLQLVSLKFYSTIILVIFTRIVYDGVAMRPLFGLIYFTYIRLFLKI